MNVHYDHRAARAGTVDALQRPLGRLLNAQVNRQHHILAGLGRTPDVLGLAVADVVHQHRLGASHAAQLFVQTILDADDATVIRQAVGEEGLFAFHRAVVALQMADHVGGGGVVRIVASGLDLQIHPHRAGGLLLEERDLGGVQIRQHRIGQGEAGFVMALEVGGIQRRAAAAAAG